MKSSFTPFFLLCALWLLGQNPALAQQTRLVLKPKTPLLPFVGQNLEVIGWVTHVETSPEYGHQKAFIQSGDGFYVFVRGQTREAIGQFDLQTYKAKRIRLSGTVAEYEGAPHIVIESLDQFGTAAGPSEPEETVTVEPTPTAISTQTFATSSASITIPQITFEPTPATAVLNRWAGTVAPREQSVHIMERPISGPDGTPSAAPGQPPPPIIRSTHITRPNLLGFVGKPPINGSAVLREVSQFLASRHPDWPTEKRILYSSAIEGFRDDSVSAALGWALIAEAMKTGQVIPENVAAIGNLNAEGQVLPIYDLQNRLAPLAQRGVEIAIIPRASAPALTDLTIDGQLGLLQQMQVITVENFEEAWATAILQQGTDVERSILLFEEAFQLQQADAAEMQHIGTLNPAHASAYVCYLAFTRQLPTLYTLQGSWERLRAIRKPFERLLSRSPNYLPRTTPDAATIKEVLWDLQKLRKTLDPGVHPYHDALEDFIEVVQQVSPEDRYEAPRKRTSSSRNTAAPMVS